MKSKLMISLFAFTLSLAFSYAAHADRLHEFYEDVTETDLSNSIILSAESSMAFINGDKVSGVQPIVQEGRTLVPLRFISEAFGATVDYYPKSQSITIKQGDNSIALQLGSKTLTINGTSRAMDVVPKTHNNSTYIPLRDIGEVFNKKVVYLKPSGYQSHSLIILRDADATALEDLNLSRVLELVYQGKSVVYSDRFMVVIKKTKSIGLVSSSLIIRLISFL